MLMDIDVRRPKQARLNGESRSTDGDLPLQMIGMFLVHWRATQ